MSKRMSETEKLAIHICWHGFGDPKKATGSRTANAYWKIVCPEAKKGYRKHAAELIWWTRRLGVERLAQAVKQDDQR